MSDTPEDNGTDLGPMTVEYPANPQLVSFGGTSSMWTLSHPEETTHFDQIKGCIGQITVTLPNGNDETKFIIRVGDTFDLRPITECIPYQSDKEYTLKDDPARRGVVRPLK